MQDQLPEVSNIRIENEDGTQYGCNFGSGFCEGMDGRNGRIYAAIQKAIADGVTPDPFSDPSKTPEAIALKELQELDKQADRTTEDLYDALLAKGVLTEADVDSFSVARIKRKKELRGQL